MLTKLAIWYLKKRKVSVLIGFIVQGGAIQQDNRHASLYNNTLMRTKYFDYEGKRLDIPGGKFNYSRSGDE